MFRIFAMEGNLRTKVIRHDPVTLSSGVKEDDFEKFMVEELIPLFSKHYKGPTEIFEMHRMHFQLPSIPHSSGTN